jgi:tetratricopeptide (TPR) repeat protein
MSNASEKVTINEAVNGFVQKNRKVIFVFFGALLVILAGFIATISIAGAVRNKALAGAEELNRRYEALRPSLNDEAKAPEVSALLEELTRFAEKNSGYAGGWIWSIVGGIHAEKKEWAGAEEAYAQSARTAAKTYLSPVSYFNAAAAAEEQGRTAEAIDYYTRCTEFPGGFFPALSRAQFAIGRLQEDQGNAVEALDAYRKLIAADTDSVWTNLARSRIIFLEKDASEGEGEDESEESGS